MTSIRTSHCATECANALSSANRVVLDLETTGVRRHDTIVAAGLLCGGVAHILVTDQHRDISSVGLRMPVDCLRSALAPLAKRPELSVVMHNAAFDVGMLERAGISVKCRVADTLKLVKLVDSDRGTDFGDTSVGSQRPRRQRSTGQPLNYRLKDLARTILGVRPLDFPGAVAELHLEQLVRYLKSDLLVTDMLHQQIERTIDSKLTLYSEMLVEPLTPLLVQMSNIGVAADESFLSNESRRLIDLMHQISTEHESRFGQGLDVGDWYLRRWIYFQGLKCPVISSGKQRRPSLRTQDLLKLRDESFSPLTRASLELIHDYKQVQSLMTRLCSLEKHVCRQTHRIYSSFNDTQSSGRVSSTKPNLQQIAGTLESGGRKQLVSPSLQNIAVRSRNVLQASQGHTLVACDIAQADIRVLAHMAEALGTNGTDHLNALHAARYQRLGPQIQPFLDAARQYLQPANRADVRCPHCWTRLSRGLVLDRQVRCPRCERQFTATVDGPHFDPEQLCQLAEDFRNAGGDFYTAATRRMLGREPRDKTERNHMKQTILGIVNGMSSHALAERLQVEIDEARRYLLAFSQAYPRVDAYRMLSKFEFAITGRSFTFAGHHRRITAHYWMVSEPLIDLFVSYRGADKLWLSVVPLRPNRHTLTCWVLNAIDAKYGSKNEGLEIYHHEDGRISEYPYRFFEDSKLIYRLPVRNIAWRLIRRVRTRNEESDYDGYDKTWRQLFNHVAQGGTADIVKMMMLSSRPVCDQYAARLLLQIHDELVFEVPDQHVNEFVFNLTKVLTHPPSNEFRVPIVVEPKVGKRFGELKELRPCGT